MLLKSLYEREEELGLDRFNSALTQSLKDYNSLIIDTKETRELTDLISDTNRKLQMRFKREHSYKVEKYEERLYKEVVYDARPDTDPEEVY